MAIPEGALWVRMPRFIGDAMMITQAVAPLRAAGHSLVAWGPPPIMDLFEGSAPYAATVPDVGKPGALPMARLLRAHRAAGVINLPRSTRGLLAGALACTPIRVGWSESGGRFLASRAIPFKGREDHQLDRYREVLRRAFPAVTAWDSEPFRPRAAAMDQADRLLGGLGVEGRFVGIGLSAAAAVKRLGTGIWIEVIARLRARGIPHVLLGGNHHEDLEQAEALRAVFPGISDLCGKTSLAVSAALAARAAAVVGNDSGLSHIVAASQVPLVAVFGPTRPTLTAPQGPQVVVLRNEAVPCLGCLRLGCPVAGHPCMEAVDAAALSEALEKLLGETA
ncbi:glycosyltransferase family 9 protein [Geothrix sp. PMB-07]|uniref:glycosyltransferase family 9 protein n=1 Tax=Geothrix sp. PMB-07 TaxID=3068640 RepID=UPI00274076CE|nr:glycosyltransferase family 9 protein [Geothrix sp. PMB-07]WLT33235.1 glycosyltransferase family 9 protein [Geothrix sp. PMB-07]